MRRYTVLHRHPDGSYAVYSSYDSLAEINCAMYDEFLNARLGSEFVVLDSQCSGNAVDRIYSIERRVVFRNVGSAEKAWPLAKRVSSSARELGDGAWLVRYY